MSNLPVGTIQTMAVLRRIETGYVLEKEGNQALLHNHETEKPLSVYEQVDVFLYHDKRGQVVATTTLPSIQRDTYGWAEVVESVQDLGVFITIGTTKEILISKDDLPLFTEVWPTAGDKLYVTLGEDQKGRLLALPATESTFMHMREIADDDMLNHTVGGHIYHTSKEGSALFTSDGYRGFIHHTERKEEPRLGQFVEGRVIAVKEDGTLNISLRPLKQYSIGDDAQAILDHLHDNQGVIPFTDKSDPEDIRGTYQISKAAFKRALGKLMKERLIEQRDGHTYLIDKNSTTD